MHNTVLDLRYALRMLYRKPGFAAVAVLTLAVGIGANTAVFTVVNAALLRPLPFPEPERLYLVSYLPRDFPVGVGPGLFDRHYLEFHRQDRVFESLTTYGTSTASLTGAGEPVRVTAASVTADFFSVFRAHPALGRTLAPGEDQPGHDAVAMLSDRLWRSHFGADTHVLGRTIKIDGIARTVIGVMPPAMQFPGAELWIPLEVRANPHTTMTRTVVGRLKPGITQTQARGELEALRSRWTTFPGMQTADMRAEVLPMRELFVAGFRKSLWIFAGAVGFVLLIACANVANLFLTRAVGRQQETTLRSALGASRWRLIRQLLAESALVSLIGGAVGVLLAWWGVPALLALAPEGVIPRADALHIDGLVLAFTLGISVLTGIGFGLAPALRATSRELRDSLSQSGRTLTGRHDWLRGALVVSEIALALVLVTGAGLLVKSFLRMRSVDPGFRTENLLLVTLEAPHAQHLDAGRARALFRQFGERLSRLAGVRAVGAASFPPIAGRWIRGDFQVEGGRRLPPGFDAFKPVVTPGYFRAMGIRLVRGRDFTDRDDASAAGVVIVSRSVARQAWPAEDPLGKRISNNDHPSPRDRLTVVGIVDDVVQVDVTQPLTPAIYQTYLQAGDPDALARMTYALRTAGNPAALASGVRGALREIDPDQPASMIASMADLIRGTQAGPLFQMRLLGTFSLMALVLAAVGIYGVLAYSVTERTREIGIRIALGAERGAVLGLVMRQTLTLAAAGVAIGAAGALAATRVLAAYLFDVKPTDPGTLIAVIALLTTVAICAAWIPARRATRIDPTAALRYE
ncbi:MAG: ABC transporter permease [Acidobacteriia bacterium]|nr:ABC transporter permease [Terriglobia bacterium]